MKNMSRVSKFILIAVAALAVMACGGSKSNDATDAANVTVAGKLAAAADAELVFGRLDKDQMLVLDTLKTAADSTFKYELHVAEGDPEFVYVIKDNVSLAYLLLKAGDSFNVDIDEAGLATITGSEESEKLTELQREHAQMDTYFAGLVADLENAPASKQASIAKKMSDAYIQYNKSSRTYVMQNSSSLTAIPVLYRQLGALPVFNEPTDALLFNTVAGSLRKVYPKSRYVKTLVAMAEQRTSQFELANRIENAEQVGYFDVELPGLDGQNKKLSDLDSKVVLLYFWTAASAEQNNFNVDVLKKIYDKYHSKGFDIYQVSLDVDKVMWATTLMGQELPWTNVCDSRGVASPYVAQYNLQALPAAFVINNGELVDGNIVDEASFRRVLDKLLK